jgi:hypothetical protein
MLEQALSIDKPIGQPPAEFACYSHRICLCSPQRFLELFGGDSNLAEPYRQLGEQAREEIDYERSIGGAGCLSFTRGCVDASRHGMRSVRVLLHQKGNSSYAYRHSYGHSNRRGHGHRHGYEYVHGYCHSYVHGHSHGYGQSNRHGYGHSNRYEYD